MSKGCGPGLISMSHASNTINARCESLAVSLAGLMFPCFVEGTLAHCLGKQSTRDAVFHITENRHCFQWVQTAVWLVKADI